MLDEPLDFFPDQEGLLRFECRNPKCFFATSDSQKLFNHEQTCSSNTKIRCKQIAQHRPDETIRNALVTEGIIPSPDWHNWHFACFDCECFMDVVEEVEGIPKSIHRLVSIGIKTSFGQKSEFYIERENMEPLAVKSLVQEFVSTLIELRTKMLEFIPPTIIRGHKKYLELTMSKDFKKLSVEAQDKARKKLSYLSAVLRLKVYSWNGERYDHNVVWAPLLDVLQSNEKEFKKLHIIRRGSGLMEFSYGSLVFQDFLNFSNPMSLDKFARSCGITGAGKTTFPYEMFGKIQQLREVREFPKYPNFYSSLTNTNISYESELINLCNEKFSAGIWTEAADINSFFGFSPELEFEISDRKILSISSKTETSLKKILHTSPLKYFESKIVFESECATMADYLRVYNLNDVILLEKCIRTYAKGFFDSWKVNIHSKMSLPGVAQGIV